MKLSRKALSHTLLIVIILNFGFIPLRSWDYPNGTYATHGEILLMNGSTIKAGSIVNFQSDEVYELQFSGAEYSREFTRRISDSFLGSYRVKTVSSTSQEKIHVNHSEMMKILFNQSYYGKKNSKLTLYRLLAHDGDLCGYILELRKLVCFSREQRPSTK